MVARGYEEDQGGRDSTDIKEQYEGSSAYKFTILN